MKIQDGCLAALLSFNHHAAAYTLLHSVITEHSGDIHRLFGGLQLQIVCFDLVIPAIGEAS